MHRSPVKEWQVSWLVLGTITLNGTNNVVCKYCRTDRTTLFYYLFFPPTGHTLPLTGELLLLSCFRLWLRGSPIPAPGGRRCYRQPERREVPRIEPETSRPTD